MSHRREKQTSRTIGKKKKKSISTVSAYFIYNVFIAQVNSEVHTELPVNHTEASIFKATGEYRNIFHLELFLEMPSTGAMQKRSQRINNIFTQGNYFSKCSPICEWLVNKWGNCQYKYLFENTGSFKTSRSLSQVVSACTLQKSMNGSKQMFCGTLHKTFKYT